MEYKYKSPSAGEGDTSLALETQQTVNDDERPRKSSVNKELWWRHILHWFQANTFSPAFLSGSWSSPALGYLAAILLQVIMVTMIVILLTLFSGFRFPTALVLLGVLLIAFGWGAGPSVIATLFGGALLMFLVFPPYFSLAVALSEDVVGICLYIAVGLTISLLASQTQRARYRAETISQRLEAIIEAIPDSVVIYDPSGKPVQYNQVARVRSVPVGGDVALVDMPLHLDLHDINGAQFKLYDLPVTRALKGEKVDGVEMRYQYPGELKEHFVSVSAAPLRSKLHGTIDGVVTVTRDIATLRQLERRAAERANELEAIFDAITDGVFIIDGKGALPQMNLAARNLMAIFEQVPDKKGTHPFFDLLDEQEQPLPYELWPESRLLKGEALRGTDAADVRFRSHDGRIHYLSATGAPIFDADGHIAGAVLVTRDVTERRTLEERTHKALEALLQMAQVMVEVPDREETAEYATERFASRQIAQRLAQMTRDVLGCQRLSLTMVDPATEVLRPMAVVGLSPEQEQAWWAEQERQQARLTDNNPDPVIIERLRRNEVVLLDLTQPPWEDLPNPYAIRTMLIAPLSFQNQILGLLSLDYGGAEHIYTEQEIALTQAVSRFLALVVERDRLLSERALAQASTLALRESNHLMNEFLGIAGHEIRTPLTTIKANIQLARRQLNRAIQNNWVSSEDMSKTIETVQSFLERTERQIARQNRLVRDLLDVSKIQAGQLELRPAQFDLLLLVREVVDDQRSLAPAHPIRLEITTNATMLVEADRDRVGQVIDNYLSNALKYSEADKPVVVSVECDHAMVRVLVCDEGPGLSPEEHQRIWERFYRVPGIDVKSGSGVGLGLGLHISRSIIERQGGQVGVESVQGKGSTFWFTLPVLSEH